MVMSNPLHSGFVRPSDPSCAMLPVKLSLFVAGEVAEGAVDELEPQAAAPASAAAARRRDHRFRMIRTPP